MANLLAKSTRTIKSQSTGEELTDELYDKLNPAYQLLTMIAEALEITPMVGDYQGKLYLTRSTIDEIYAALK